MFNELTKVKIEYIIITYVTIRNKCQRLIVNKNTKFQNLRERNFENKTLEFPVKIMLSKGKMNIF